MKIEIKKWRKINNVGSNIAFYFNVKHIPNPNILFFVCYRNYKNSTSLEKIASYFRHNIAHLTHYYAFPVQYSNAIKNIKNIHIAADADVSNNAFFKTYFSWYTKPVLIVPFAISNRFTIKKNFAQRDNKAIATGTFHMLENDVTANDPICFEIKKQSNTIHPVRRMLYENMDTLQQYVVVFCKPFYEKNIAQNNKGKISNKMDAAQAAYFSFDIVEKYNQFKFAIIGEESIVGLPGIGSFEAMACGCVLLGNTACYAGTGAVAGTHYIPYDGTMPSIAATITNNLNNAALEQISNNARRFVAENMRPEILQEKFYSLVKSL